MEDLVLKCLSKPYCHMIKDINHITQISKSNIEIILNNLIEKDLVYKKNKLYYLKARGRIEIKDKGFGFICIDGSDDDYYVSEFDTNGAANGDLVEFYILPSDNERFSDNAVVISILEHKFTNVIGRLVTKSTKKGVSYFVTSFDKNNPFSCTVKESDLNGAFDGSIVSARITEYLNTTKANGYVEKILGNENDPGIDISVIAERYGFFKEFPDVVMSEVSKIPQSVNPNDYKDRRNFTDKLIITIDGDDSKDFDDAVSLEILENGNYELGVYIADVAEYVKKGHPLDEEALFRGTSVYLADRVIPMLPHALSNGICSLNEGVYRLTLACIMEINEKGKLVNYEICEGIIKSAHRMTYSNVNKMLDGDREVIERYKDIYPMILEMNKLSHIIRGLRERKGAIDFDVPEYKVEMNEQGEPISFNLRSRADAEMLIEDFMLSANETVAYHMSISNLPCAYRIHEKPDYDSISKVFTLINELGFKAILPKNKVMPKDIQKAMNMMKKSDSFDIINQLMLRSMAKAKYSEKNEGHYGLAMEYYCHFTSPIRRYPDLITHRIIKSLLIHPLSFDEKLQEIESTIHEICSRSSLKEREAIDCEREVFDMLCATFMESHIGAEFKGTVDSITKFGMFVMLDIGVEGLIHLSNMKGYYTFNESSYTLDGIKRSYKIGDPVEIVVIDASKKRQTVDFQLKDDYYCDWR